MAGHLHNGAGEMSIWLLLWAPTLLPGFLAVACGVLGRAYWHSYLAEDGVSSAANRYRASCLTWMLVLYVGVGASAMFFVRNILQAWGLL